MNVKKIMNIYDKMESYYKSEQFKKILKIIIEF